ncbi:VPLPA-CTERM sorting domain-containing protein [Sulfuriferula sp.]|uniref:VPLPA-CTERM sorting domain-containing protein n=1 Tax=Sulfuriferula sp. TaxID=2025307 RepID=UPI00272F00BE|nr:VPLPA-CTERM sorting domain-containing protein [Sulfuriferula sp.]MDP2026004.1 VPLPA-CTERM sorting domain-containing protein [Sulfuriferula sp.]
MKILQTALLCACAIAGQASAAPVFQLGVDNNMGFQSVANKTGNANSIAVGDLYYGVINVQDIATGTTSWNANNVSTPIDSFTGYFLTQVTGVTATVTALGTFYSAQLGVATNPDPNGVFTAGELSAGTMMKLYTDTSTAYTTGGPVAADIAHATDGSLWASLGFTSASNYWTLAVAPGGFAASGSSFGGLNFMTNNSGMAWAKVLDTNCGVAGGCLEDMKFVSTFSQTSGGAWQANVNDPATLHPVPLPAAGWLLGSGLVALLGLRGKRKYRAESCSAA